PTYPFQRRRYWIETKVSTRSGHQAEENSSWIRVLDASERQSKQAPIDVNVSSFPAKWNCLEKVTRAYALQTLKQLGAFAVPDRKYSVDEILSQLEIRPIY